MNDGWSEQDFPDEPSLQACLAVILGKCRPAEVRVIDRRRHVGAGTFSAEIVLALSRSSINMRTCRSRVAHARVNALALALLIIIPRQTAARAP